MHDPVVSDKGILKHFEQTVKSRAILLFVCPISSSLELREAVFVFLQAIGPKDTKPVSD